jgi:hypothetical protein
MLRRFLLGAFVLVACISITAAQDITATPRPVNLTPPVLGDFNADAVSSIKLDDYPVLPTVTEHAQTIYMRGQKSGRNAKMLSKIGDCMTAAEYFLVPFGKGDFDLGAYSNLKPVVNYFTSVSGSDAKMNGFDTIGLATDSGFTTASVLDSTWSNTKICKANESPLSCEYRVSNSAFALIMFGTNDVFYFEPKMFDYYLRLIVLQTINTDVVPVLYTFPVRPEFPEKTLLFNQIVVKIASDYDIPLVNMVKALETLPDQGVNTKDTIHLSLPEDGKVGVFSDKNLKAGYTFRNLLTLQTLDILWRKLDKNPS